MRPASFSRAGLWPTERGPCRRPGAVAGENRREARVRGRRGVSLALPPFLSIVPRAPPSRGSSSDRAASERRGRTGGHETGDVGARLGAGVDVAGGICGGVAARPDPLRVAGKLTPHVAGELTPACESLARLGRAASGHRLARPLLARLLTDARAGLGGWPAGRLRRKGKGATRPIDPGLSCAVAGACGTPAVSGPGFPSAGPWSSAPPASSSCSSFREAALPALSQLWSPVGTPSSSPIPVLVMWLGAAVRSVGSTPTPMRALASPGT